MCFTWPMAAMMSSKVYMIVNRPLEHLRKSLTLRDLSEVQDELSRLSLLTLWSEHSLPRRSLDLRIYQALISILDGKRLLLTRLRAAENENERNWGSAISEGARLFQRGERGERWDDALLGRARSLQRLLVRVDDGLKYHELVAAYGHVGGTLRRGLP